uniref:Uncharacterized protein n=1 Tax=Oryza punctata TaxID=4537 RepID=A0A0E0KEJ6_ORYPU
MDRKKRRNSAAAAAAAAAVDGAVRFDGMSSKQLVRLWEDVIDRDVVAGRKVFFRALLRDAAAKYNKQAAAVAAAARGAAGEEDGQDRGYQHEQFVLRPCTTPCEASPPPEPMVVLCLRAAPPTPHLAVGGLKREAPSRDATAENKQEEAVRCAAAAGVKKDGGGEDQGRPPHERLSSTPRWEASPPSEPTHNNAPTVVLCLPARHRRRVGVGGRRTTMATKIKAARRTSG